MTITLKSGLSAIGNDCLRDVQERALVARQPGVSYTLRFRLAPSPVLWKLRQRQTRYRHVVGKIIHDNRKGRQKVRILDIYEFLENAQ